MEQPSASTTSSLTTTHINPKRAVRIQNNDDDLMQVDDTKHKVYIYDLDAELSDSDTSDDGRLVFLPDIEKHLRESRIPPSILANSEGELAGQKQMVLYNVPASLSVPVEKDSVRKAIIESRARARARAALERSQAGLDIGLGGVVGSRSPNSVPVSQEAMNLMSAGLLPNGSGIQEEEGDDPDAMDLG